MVTSSFSFVFRPAVQIISFCVSFLSRVDKLNMLSSSQCMGRYSSAARGCSANAEATGSNPVEAPNHFFSGQLRNCLNSDSTAIVTHSFSKNEIKKPPIISIHFIQHQKKALLSNFQLNGHTLGFSPRTRKKSQPNRATLHILNKITEKCRSVASI